MKVLLVEDESLIAEGLRYELTKCGYTVVGIVHNGLEVLPEVKSKKPNIVLMDINIPGINGLEAARFLSEQYPVAVVILTGYSDHEYVRQATKMSVEGYLLKPVDENDLKPAMEVAFANFQKKKALSNELEKSKEELINRKLIERAKGILMDHKGLKESEAMSVLQKKSRDSGKKLADIATDIIKAFKILDT